MRIVRKALDAVVGWDHLLAFVDRPRLAYRGCSARVDALTSCGAK